MFEEKIDGQSIFFWLSIIFLMMHAPWIPFGLALIGIGVLISLALLAILKDTIFWLLGLPEDFFKAWKNE